VVNHHSRVPHEAGSRPLNRLALRLRL
jgi:hypothetical protein